MKKLIWPISVTSFIAFLYLISIALNFPYPFISILFGALPLFTIWMVIRILKDGRHSGKTFDEDFYEVK